MIDTFHKNYHKFIATFPPLDFALLIVRLIVKLKQKHHRGKLTKSANQAEKA